MRKITIALFFISVAFLLWITTIAHAEDTTVQKLFWPSDQPWTATDSILEGSFELVNLLDWAQTLNMTKQPGYYELGFPNGSAWLIGSHPKQAHINEMMGSLALLHPTISYILPQPYRRYWQWMWISAKEITVQNNAKIGAGMAVGFSLLF